MTAISPALQKAFITTAYEEVDKLITHTVKKFILHYGGDFTELIGEAYELFMDAYRDFDDERGVKWTTWVGYKVFRGLQANLRKRITRNNRLKRVEADLNHYNKPNGTFSLDNLLDMLSPEAQEMVKLVLEPSFDMKLKLRKDTPGQIRWALRSFLVCELGWTQDKFNEHFREIKEVL